VHWGDDHTSVPKIKKRLETATELLKSSYYEDNRRSTKDLATLMGAKVFDNPKSPRLIRRLLAFASSRDGIIMDFFAGSGTAGDAVIAQNAADGGRRKYILVQLPEPLDPENREQRLAADYCDSLGKPRNIAELTKERLRRSAVKLRAENPGFGGDSGFRVMKLDSSNIRAWDPSRDNIDQALLDFVDHLQADRTDEDLLYELLIKRGLELDAPVEQRVIAGKTVYSVGGGELIACFAKSIVGNDVDPIVAGIEAWRTELATGAETTCIFRDSAFADDTAKTNLTAALAQGGIRNVRSL
jgi:adenine-specific DNA-methyltransferase